MADPQTKPRILDAARRLFAEHGIQGTSLRQITQEAEVNLAAVNYHFGSKDGLIKELIEQELSPINMERERRLDEAVERHGDSPIPVRELNRIFLEPAVQAMHQCSSFGPCLLTRLHQDPSPDLKAMCVGILAPTIRRFVAETHRTLPEQPTDVLLIRGHFMVGALLHILDAQAELQMEVPGALPERLLDPEFRLEQLIAFCTAGFHG